MPRSSSSRSALLIGVPEYRDSNHNLPFIRDDLDELYDVFRDAAYDVVHPFRGHQDRISRADIIAATSDFCTGPQADTVVVYLSGHGMHYEGKDYLIPGDALVNRPDPSDFLVGVDDVVGEFERAHAIQNLVVFIDACREGLELNTKSTQYVRAWGEGKRRELSNRRVVYVYGCEPGQYSYHNQEYSFLSKALARVHRETDASTYSDVLNAMQEQLRALAEENGYTDRQSIRYRMEATVGESTDALVIFERDEAGGEGRAEEDPWTEAIRTTRLWPSDDQGDPDRTEAFRQHAVRIAHACRERWEVATDGLKDDPWADEAFPVRVVERAAFLAGRQCEVSLNAAEVALLVVAPFVREMALAVAHRAVVDEASPFAEPDADAATGVCESGRSEGLRGDLEKVFRSHPHHVRRAARLWDDGQVENYRTVAAWLVNRCVARLPAVWRPEADDGLFPTNAFAGVDEPDRDDVAECLNVEHLRSVARWAIADAGRLDDPDAPNAPQVRRFLAPSTVDEAETRETVVAALLALSNRLAIDGRTLSDVIVEHVGLSRPIDPDAILPLLDSLRWYPEPPALALQGTCPHPALDLALREHVAGSDAFLTDLNSLVHQEKHGLEVLEQLPQRLTDHRLDATADDDGAPAYETPHLRFHLDPNEIQELLMGKQLYGDPALAIREMYQNALDACRYRRARTQYLERTEKGFTSNWIGRIEFRQGVTDDGRAYIECEDNGIGMGRRELTSAFAKAGSRYHDLPEFIEEQAEWEQLDPPIELYPNSQFGIGVFSYFMLADELEIETTRLQRDGTSGPRLRIDVTGSGSLFHVRTLPDASGTGGTRIRLYLRENLDEDLDEPVSCVNTLREILWVAEFETRVMHSEREEVWPANRLVIHDLPLVGQRTNALDESHLPITSLQTDRFHWWLRTDPVSKLDGERFHLTRNVLEGLLPEGRLLADGIVTDVTIPGSVVNLAGREQPKLNVTRTKVLSFDRSFGRNLLQAGIEKLPARPEWLEMDWLWAFGADDPDRASSLLSRLLETDSAQSICSKSLSLTHKYDLKRIGCFPPDQLLWFRGRPAGYYLRGIPDSIWAARIRIHLTDRLSQQIGVRSHPSPIPVPPQALRILHRNLRDREDSRLTNVMTGIRLARVYRSGCFPLSASPRDVRSLIRAIKTSVGIDCTRLEGLDFGHLMQTRMDLEDERMLSEYFGGKRPLEHDLDGLHVVAATHRMDLSLKKIEERLRYLEEPLGLNLDKVDFPTLRDISLRDDDLKLLSAQHGAYGPYCREITLGSFLAGNATLEGDPLERYRRLQLLAKPLGVDISELKNKRIDFLCREFEGLIYEYLQNGVGLQAFPNSITGVNLFGAARRHRKDPVRLGRDLQDRIVRGGYDGFGFDLENLNEIQVLNHDLDFLSRNLEGDAPYLSSLSKDRLVMMAWFFREPASKILDRLKPLESVGFTLPELDEDGLI